MSENGAGERRLSVRIAVAILCAGASVGHADAAADSYPARPIRLIVGFAPGGVADLLARALASRLNEPLQQQVIVDNRPGGGGVISMQIAARAPRDGHTLLIGSSTQYSITPSLRPNLPYDVVRDFTPVSRAALTPVILTVQPTLPVKSVRELVELAKTSAPAVLSYGSTGYGGAPHIAAELLKKTTGMAMTHVPFKGGSEAVTALLGGHLQASFGAVSTALPHVRAARLRALGVTSAQRLSAVPDVPTFAESGLAGFAVEQWYGMFAPARLPDPVVRTLNRELVRALDEPRFKEQFALQGVELGGSSPEALASYVKSELLRWGRVLKELGIQDAP